jgi:integrase
MATISKQGAKWKAQIRRRGLGCATRSFTKKADAEAWARATEAGIEAGTYTAKPKEDAATSDPKQVTLTKLMERYRDEVTVNKKGKDAETYWINAFIRDASIANKSVSDVTAKHWCEYRDKRLKEVKKLKNGEKPAIKAPGLKRQLAVFSNVYHVAKTEWGYKIDNPLSGVEVKGPKPKKRDRRLTQQEYEKVIAEAKRRKNPLIAHIIEWAKESAMRRSEVLRVEWGHVNFADRELLIPDQKNGEVSKVPLTKKMIEILEAQDPTNDLCFPIKLANLESTVKRVLEKVRLKGDFCFHLWRHERVSNLFEAGLTIPEVAKVSRHKDWRMLQSYTHIRPQAILAKLEPVT